MVRADGGMPRLAVVTQYLPELSPPSRPRQRDTYLRVNDILSALADREDVPEPAVNAPLFNIWRRPPV